MPLPDYMIIGAMKCGTSTLAAQLGAQAGIFMTTPKEPNFFSDDDVFAKGHGWYEALFDPASSDDLLGEASTHYTKMPDYPKTLERFQATLSAPKLIYLIRDPVARAVSHYVHEWTRGVMSGGFDAALIDHPALMSYGRYAEQMTPWIDAYGRDAIHIDTLEAMNQQPQAFIDRVGRFLGREDLIWKDDLGKVNVSADRTRRLPFEEILIHSAPAEWLRRTFIPRALRDRVKAARKITERPVPSEASLAWMHSAFLEDRERLHQLFPGRADLDAAYPFTPSS